MPPKSIWRDPKAQHFQVVHRSQRDPLINDPEAGDRVLKHVERGNVAKGKAKAASQAGLTRAELEARLGGDAFAKKQRANVGEAAEYGIYFDDTEYDYMQHLRTVGGEPGAAGGDEDDAAEAILLEAPKQRNLTKDRAGSHGFQLKDGEAGSSASTSAARLDLPSDVLPSKEQLPADWHIRSQQAIDPSIAGLQPDMNPHLRQTLEALDDEAFVDDELDDDFFDGIIASGEGVGDAADDADGEQDWMALPPEGEEALWKGKADQLLDGEAAGEEIDESNLPLEQRVALFKLRNKMQQQQQEREQQVPPAAQSQAGPPSSAGGKPRRTRLGVPPPASSVGGKSSIFGDTKTKTRPGVKARYAASEAGQSAFSMSSSAMFRNKGLTGLDEHFDRIEKMYGNRIGKDGEYRIPEEGEEDEEYYDEDDEEEIDGEDAVAVDENGEPISREDFDSIMDEFLNDYEVLGGKMRQSLGGTQATPQEKLELVRQALGEARLDDVAADGEDGKEEEWRPEMSFPDRKPREKWDVETIQTTKTNLENHPRTIAADSVSIAPSTRFQNGSMVSRSGFMPASISANGESSAGASSAGAASDADRIPKIKIDPRTGIPKIIGYTTVRMKRPESLREQAAADEAENRAAGDSDEDSDAESDTTEGPHTVGTLVRPRNESTDEKKARKAAVKEAKAARRAQKSMTKQAFSKEKKKQAKEFQARVKDGGAADVGRNGLTTSATGVMRL